MTPRSVRVRVLHSLAVLTLVGLMSGCEDPSMKPVASNAAQAETAASQAIPVGKDLAGEPCRATQSSDIIEALGASKVLDLKCGNWSKPSGHLLEVSSHSDDLLGLATTGAWRNDIDTKLTCQPPQQTAILNGIPAQWLRCARRNGGLPHVAFVSIVNGKIYYVDGLPPSQPALERLIGQLAGIVQANSADTASSSSAIELLKEQFNGKLVGNADRAQYDRLMQLGRGFNNEGSYAQAIAYYRDALKLQQQLMGANNPDSIQPMMNLAVALSNKQSFTEANQLFTRASELINKDTEPAVKAQFLYYRAMNEANQRHREAALKLANEASAEFQQLLGSPKAASASDAKDQLFAVAEPNNSSNTASKVNIDISLVEVQALAARMERGIGGAGESQKIVNQVRPVAEKGAERSPDTYANVLQVSGDNLFDLGDKERAEKDMRTALAELDKHLANTQPQARAYMRFGAMLYAQKRLPEALVAFRTAVSVAKAKKLTFPVAVIFPYLDTLYESSGKDTAANSALYSEMFEASQLARSGAASEFINEAAAQLAQGSGDAAGAIREFREKKTDYERLQNRLDGEMAKPITEQDPIAVAELEEKVKTAEKDKDEAEVRVQALAPNFNQLSSKTIHTDDVVKAMRPNEAIYSILLGEKTSYAFFIRGGKVTAFQVPMNNLQAKHKVGEVREAFVIRAGADGNATFSPFDVDASYDLYNTLFQPIDDQLSGLSKLIVAQSGPLLSLPFALLVTKKPPVVENDDYTKVDWLIQRTAISYVTSMQSFVILRDGTPGNRAPKAFVGFGDYQQPSFSMMKQFFADPQCKNDLDALEELGPLPGTKPEVLSVAQTMGAAPSDIILGSNFNKHTLAGINLADYRILHFATHAMLPTDLKCRQLPTMLVSLPPGGTNLEDVFFDTGEILKLKLNADMVVLSACNTSSQGDSGGSGESLSGLAQAFFLSGARGLVVSHWLAADQTTVALMGTLYKQVATGKVDTANALRFAQMEMLQRAGKEKDFPAIFSHPLFWSVFTALGDGVQPNAAAASSQISEPVPHG